MITTTTLPAKVNGNGLQLSAPQVKLLEELKSTIPLDRQLSWLQLSNLKLQTEEKMVATELSLQPLLKDYEKMNVEALEKAVNAYKEGLKALPDIRKGCTRYIDKIADSLMAIEKRAGGETKGEDGKWKRINDFILDKASARLIELKEAEEEKLSEGKRRAEELAAFKAHVQNGLVKIRTEYEKALNKAIVDGYAVALGQELTEAGLKQCVKVTETVMREIKRITPEKYEFKYWNKLKKEDMDELMKINNSIAPPDWNKILQEYLKKMHDQFNLYWQDKNTTGGVDFISNKADEFENFLEAKAEEQMAVNTLAAKGAATVVTPAANFKPLNRKFVIEVNDEDPTCAKTILSLFLANWNTCAPRLKVSKWGNLSIKQMAAALQEESEMFDGLKYKEVKK